MDIQGKQNFFEKSNRRVCLPHIKSTASRRGCALSPPRKVCSQDPSTTKRRVLDVGESLSPKCRSPPSLLNATFPGDVTLKCPFNNPDLLPLPRFPPQHPSSSSLLCNTLVQFTVCLTPLECAFYADRALDLFIARVSVPWRCLASGRDSINSWGGLNSEDQREGDAGWLTLSRGLAGWRHPEDRGKAGCEGQLGQACRPSVAEGDNWLGWSQKGTHQEDSLWGVHAVRGQPKEA